MAATVQEFRFEEVSVPENLVLRLNQLVKRVNEVNPRWKAVRIPSVRTGQQIALPAPGFVVAAIILGGVRRTDGSDNLSASPWVEWTTSADGRLSVNVRGLSALPAQYAVNLVLFEGEGTK